MSSVYEIRSRHRLFISLALLGAIALLFYILQNKGQLVGGAIALPKLMWLAYAILFWYVLPLLIVLDRRSARGISRAYAIFLINMSLRAVIELWMMYVTLTWHPYYGIAHDVFSILLIGYFAVRTSAATLVDRILVRNLWVLCAMFAIEIVFAWYMLRNVIATDGPVYFVPTGDQHTAIMLTTWITVLGLSVYLFVFSRRWVYATAKH